MHIHILLYDTSKEIVEFGPIILSITIRLNIFINITAGIIKIVINFF